MVTLDPYDTWTAEEDYPVIRYAEVLLTYAEARIQNSGWDTEVQKALNDLRDRCGMPDVPTTMPSKKKLWPLYVMNGVLNWQQKAIALMIYGVMVMITVVRL